MLYVTKIIICLTLLFCATTNVLATNDSIPFDFKNACIEHNRMLLEADYNYRIARRQYRTGMMWLGASALVGGLGIYRSIRLVTTSSLSNQPAILSVGPFAASGVMILIGSTFFITSPKRLINYDKEFNISN